MFVVLSLYLPEVKADTIVAKLIIFSTTNNNHSFIMVENKTSEKLRIGHYNVGAGKCVTIGTWGNISQHKGIWYNLESYYSMSSHVSIGKKLTQSQVNTINSKINSSDSWNLTGNNCSSFACRIWNSVAQTQLSSGSIPLPSTLANSIKSHFSNYTKNRTIPKKTRDYIHYHTTSDKVQCSYPTFITNNSSSSQSITHEEPYEILTNIDEEYINSSREVHIDDI